jgi:TRAP-type C4-dicarboxylate transport system substrate-binding protein
MRQVTGIARVALGVLLAALVGGCGADGRQGGADKAGGSTGPVVLRLGSSDSVDTPGSSTARSFAARVGRLSGGALEVHVLYGVAGDRVPGVEARTARMVRDGKFDLGWIGARAWDELGVKSLQALQAPFLITDYALLDRVVQSPLAEEMLAGLTSRGVVGLALVPDLLRHPFGLRRPLVSLSDFAGARVRDIPSKATDMLLAALGAKPVHASNAAIPGVLARGRIDGQELSFGNASGGIAAGNVTFFGKAITLFAGRHAFDRLTDAQRGWLRGAAEQTVESVVASPPSESELARAYCADNGRIRLASGRDLAELARAARPVYKELERDPRTKALIAGIRKLKASTPPGAPLAVPSACAGPRPAGATVRGKRLSPSDLNGTYHWILTEAGARAFGAPASNPGNTYPVVNTAILRDGKWLFPGGDSPASGRYAIAGNRIAFDWPSVGYALTFTFARDHDGTLHLTPVPPMDRGDQWVWAGGPWRRAGSPVRTLP